MKVAAAGQLDSINGGCSRRTGCSTRRCKCSAKESVRSWLPLRSDVDNEVQQIFNTNPNNDDQSEDNCNNDDRDYEDDRGDPGEEFSSGEDCSDFETVSMYR